MSALCRLVFQLRTYRCNAADDERGHFQTHALQQSRGSVEIAGSGIQLIEQCLGLLQIECVEPSVNQPYTGASKSRASSRLP